MKLSFRTLRYQFRSKKNIYYFCLFSTVYLVIVFFTKKHNLLLYENDFIFTGNNIEKQNIKHFNGDDKIENANKNDSSISASEDIQPEKNFIWNRTKLSLSKKNLTRDIIAVIKKQKLKIDEEIKFLHYSPKMPTLSLVVTTFRSGSTFTSEILNSHPGTFTYYEPLYKLQDLSGSNVTNFLRDLLKCHIPEWYLKHMEEFDWLFPHNSRLLEYCKTNKSICINSNIVESMCQQFPYISMKTTRIKLQQVEKLLKDQRLNLNIVYLVRDPRGTMTSRHRAYWCMKTSCGDYLNLCQNLKEDYYTAKKFKILYPRKIRIIRYEDLSLDPYNEVRGLFDFLHLQFNEQTNTFLKEHTNVEKPGAYTTFRNSTATPFMWRTKTSYKVIKEIQEKCYFALKVWGYLLAKNASHQQTFNPLLSPFKF